MCILQRISKICPVCRNPKSHTPTEHNPQPHGIPCCPEVARRGYLCPVPGYIDEIIVLSMTRCVTCEPLFVNGQARTAKMFVVVDEHVTFNEPDQDNQKGLVEGKAKNNEVVAQMNSRQDKINQNTENSEDITQAVPDTAEPSKKKKNRPKRKPRMPSEASQVEVEKGKLKGKEKEGTSNPLDFTSFNGTQDHSIGDVMLIACERNPYLKGIMENELRKMQEDPAGLPRRLEIIDTAGWKHEKKAFRL